MAVCTYPAHAAALRCRRQLIPNHGNIFVKRGAWVHDNSKDARKIEEVSHSWWLANSKLIDGVTLIPQVSERSIVAR